MSCQEFQDQLPELIGSGEDVSNHEHLQSCELCRALLADLQTIAEAARLLIPVAEPPDKLWDSIQSAIKNEGSSKNETSNGVKDATERDLTPQRK
jgi:predicted anti-sigma-YlaC factor YlaD